MSTAAPSNTPENKSLALRGESAPPMLAGEAAQMSFPLESGGLTALTAPDMSHLHATRRKIQAVHTYPITGQPALLARKILQGLTEHARVSFVKFSDEERQRLRESRGTPMFKIRVSELRHMLEESSKDTQRIYDAIAAIYTWDIRWELISGTGESAEIEQTFTSRIISSYAPGSKGDPGLISFEFPFDVLMFMLEQRPRTEIDLRVINALGSGYAVALYDVCVPYFGTQQKVTPMRLVEDWTVALAGQGKYNNKYRDFKRYVLKPALAWLEKTDSCPFTVNLVEQSGPKGRISHLRFRLVPKVQSTLDLELKTPSWTAELCEVLAKVYEFSATDIAAAAATHNEAEIAEAIGRDRALQEAGSGSGNSAVPRKQYLMGLVKNVQLGRPKLGEPDLDDLSSPDPDVTLALDTVRTQRARFDIERNEKIADRLDKLPANRLSTLRTLFIERIDNGLAVSPGPVVLQKGWRKGNKALTKAFCQWLAEREPEVVRELIPRPEEQDFAVWLMLDQQRRSAKTPTERVNP